MGTSPGLAPPEALSLMPHDPHVPPHPAPRPFAPTHEVTTDDGATCVVKVIATHGSWIDDQAVQQLEQTARLRGMQLAVGLPDLHPGGVHPVGASFVSAFCLHPALVGNDVGCGMALFATDLPAHHRPADNWARKLAKLDQEADDDTMERTLTPEMLEVVRRGSRRGLGTIGGGNHFAELQKVAEVFDEKAFDAAGLDRKRLVLSVHSGSRGLGDSILREHVHDHADHALQSGTKALDHYLRRHDHAVAWAKANRHCIAGRFLGALRTDGLPVLDLVHNAVVPLDTMKTRFLHRKGAAPTDGPLALIPGSRGARTFLVRPTAIARAVDTSALSVAHGAGRKWRRADCKAKLERRTTAQELTRTGFGSRVICGDRQLLWEEAPPAYKDVERVVFDLVAWGLCVPVAAFEPVLTFKTTRERGDE